MMCREGSSPGVMNCAGHSRFLFRSQSLQTALLSFPVVVAKQQCNSFPASLRAAVEGEKAPVRLTTRDSPPPALQCHQDAPGRPFQPLMSRPAILWEATLRSWPPHATRAAEQSASKGQRRGRERLRAVQPLKELLSVHCQKR